MKEIVGDIFSQSCDAICITTNGITKKDGTAVMGAGVALAAAKKYPWLPKMLGACLRVWGNEVHLLTQKKQACLNMQIGIGNAPVCIIDPTIQLKYDILSLPTKHNWRDPSDILLIESSCKQLVSAADARGWQRIVLTRPGCGNGGLSWDEVKPRISKILDDRFFVIVPK